MPGILIRACGCGASGGNWGRAGGGQCPGELRATDVLRSCYLIESAEDDSMLSAAKCSAGALSASRPRLHSTAFMLSPTISPIPTVRRAIFSGSRSMRVSIIHTPAQLTHRQQKRLAQPPQQRPPPWPLPILSSAAPPPSRRTPSPAASAVQPLHPHPSTPPA